MTTVPIRRPLRALAVVAALALPACGEAVESKHVIDEPITVEEDEKAGLVRMTLTAKAVERLGIETVPVEMQDGRLVVSTDAVMVDATGERFVYVNTEPLVYERRDVEVAADDNGRAWLGEGPPPGTQVVTIGASELHGAEAGIK